MSTRRQEAYWLPSQPEDLNSAQWQHNSIAKGVVTNLKVRARYACAIIYLGPSLPELLASFNAVKSWTTKVENIAEQNAHLPGVETLRGRNERLLHILTSSFSDETRIKHINNYRIRQKINTVIEFPFNVSSSGPPRLFIGDDMAVGLVPSGAKEHDEVYQFWNVSASVVTRRKGSNRHIVGRAGIIRESEYENLDWDTPACKESFISRTHTVDLSMDIMTLTYLSLDTFNMPGT